MPLATPSRFRLCSSRFRPRCESSEQSTFVSLASACIRLTPLLCSKQQEKKKKMPPNQPISPLEYHPPTRMEHLLVLVGVRVRACALSRWFDWRPTTSACACLSLAHPHAHAHATLPATERLSVRYCHCCLPAVFLTSSHHCDTRTVPLCQIPLSPPRDGHISFALASVFCHATALLFFTPRVSRSKSVAKLR